MKTVYTIHRYIFYLPVLSRGFVYFQGDVCVCVCVCFANVCGFHGGDDKHIIGDRYSVTRLKLAIVLCTDTTSKHQANADSNEFRN